jgi:hypothetical protein
MERAQEVGVAEAAQEDSKTETKRSNRWVWRIESTLLLEKKLEKPLQVWAKAAVDYTAARLVWIHPKRTKRLQAHVSVCVGEQWHVGI